MSGVGSKLPEVVSPADALRTAMATTGWASQSNGPVAQAIKQPLLSMCSRYSLCGLIIVYSDLPFIVFHPFFSGILPSRSVEEMHSILWLTFTCKMERLSGG